MTRARVSSLVASVVASLLAASTGAHAATRDEPTPAASQVGETAERVGYMHFMGSLGFGDGLRFNNPYRLATPLGDTPESVSRSASYADFGAAFTAGSLQGFQHGMALHVSVATEGVGECVMSLSYLLYKRRGMFAGFARAGVPFQVTPQATWGLEASGGAIWFFRGGLGLSAEIIGDLFYGAATAERRVTTYPMLSGQLSLVFDYEVLP